MSRRLDRSCVSNLSVSLQTQTGCFGGDSQCQCEMKWVFPVALRVKSRRRMALSCAAHSVSTGLGEQSRVSALSAGIFLSTFFLCLPFSREDSLKEIIGLFCEK